MTGVIASSLDYMPTIASLTGLKLPTHGSSGLPLRFDGIDLSGVILHGQTVAHTSLFHVSMEERYTFHTGASSLAAHWNSTSTQLSVCVCLCVVSRLVAAVRAI